MFNKFTSLLLFLLLSFYVSYKYLFLALCLFHWFKFWPHLVLQKSISVNFVSFINALIGVVFCCFENAPFYLLYLLLLVPFNFAMFYLWKSLSAFIAKQPCALLVFIMATYCFVFSLIYKLRFYPSKLWVSVVLLFIPSIISKRLKI